MKLFSILQLAVTLIGSLVLYTWRDPLSAASYAAGAGLVLLNVISMGLLWFHVIRKKLIALSLSIIVFKYPILGIIIYKLLSFTWINRVWFSVGLASLVVTALFFAALSPRGSSTEEANED